jgi:hypothetical protein
VDEGIIDFHSHLGWHYLFTRKIDLWRDGNGMHFSPRPYRFTWSITADLISRLRHAGFAGGKWCGRHLTYAGLAQPIRFRQSCGRWIFSGLKSRCFSPIDYPVLSHNTDEWLEAVNATRDSRMRLPVFMSLHPFAGNMERRLRTHLERGACGIKIHTQMQLFRANSKGAERIYDLADKYRLPVLFHTGLSPLSPSWQKRFVNMRDIEDALRSYPGVRFILGHAGGIDGYGEAMRLSRTYGNAYLEISGQPPRVIEEMIRKTDTRRILYGSDWAFYPMALPLAKALAGTERYKKARRLILRENALALLGRDN